MAVVQVVSLHGKARGKGYYLRHFNWMRTMVTIISLHLITLQLKLPREMSSISTLNPRGTLIVFIQALGTVWHRLKHQRDGLAGVIEEKIGKQRGLCQGKFEGWYFQGNQLPQQKRQRG